MEPDLYTLHAEICQALANPKRLEIIDSLGTGEMSVTDLTKKLAIGQSNLSQHLSLMRRLGIVVVRREGLKAFYTLGDPRILQACGLMRAVLIDHLRRKANKTNDTYPGD